MFAGRNRVVSAGDETLRGIRRTDDPRPRVLFKRYVTKRVERCARMF